MLQWLSRVIGRSPPAAQEHPLLTRSRSEAPADRGAAAGLLSAVPELWAGERLLQLLQDPSADVRAAARDALRKRGAIAAPELLTGLNSADTGVATVAAELLGDLRVPEVVSPLVLVLKFGPRPVQMAARRALVGLGPVAAPALEAAREDPHAWFRQQVVEILTEIRAAPQAVPDPTAT